MTTYIERRVSKGASLFVHHSVDVPPCCPASGNPLLGSTLVISYRPNGVVLPVEALADMVSEYVGGHEAVREMEGMIQHIADRVSGMIGVRVRARADLIIKPPYGGHEQKMVVTAIGVPANVAAEATRIAKDARVEALREALDALPVSHRYYSWETANMGVNDCADAIQALIDAETAQKGE